MENLADQATKDWEGFKKRYILPTVLKEEWDLVVDFLFDGCYGFQMFHKDFCDQAIEEAEKNGSWGSGQRTSNEEYPTHDILLQDINLNVLYGNLLVKFVYPAIIHKYHLETILGNVPPYERFISENFLAKYSVDSQAHLSLHHDFSGITTLLTLNNDFEGGGTWFVNQQKLIKNDPGYIVFHPGMFSHYHGARPVTSGKRYAIITFNNWL